jgi:predicted nucleotidyltransferase
VSVATLVENVARVPGVIAVTLGGSRARGMARPDSDSADVSS